MSVLGQSIIAGQSVHGANGTSHAINPATGEALAPTIYFIGVDEIDQAARAGQAAFDTYRNTSPEERAVFLETIAANLDAMKAEIVERAQQESGLTAARLKVSTGAQQINSDSSPRSCA